MKKDLRKPVNSGGPEGWIAGVKNVRSRDKKQTYGQINCVRYFCYSAAFLGDEKRQCDKSGASFFKRVCYNTKQEYAA